MAGKSKVASKRRQSQTLPLSAIHIEEVTDLGGIQHRRPEVVNLAFALDMVDRFHWRNSTEDWPPKPESIASAFHGLSQLLRSRLVEDLGEDAQEFLGLSVTYLAVMAEMVGGGSSDIERAARYVVRLDGPAAAKAVA